MPVAKKKGSPVLAYPSKCVGCLTCELRCSLKFERAFNPGKAAIQIRRVVGQEDEFIISFDDRCDNCGICARYCLSGALIWQKESVA